MITFDELAPLWLRRVVPKEAERGAIGLQMVVSSSQEERVYTVVRRAGSCRAASALLPNSNALVSRPDYQCWSTHSVSSVRVFIPRRRVGLVNPAIIRLGLIGFIGLRLTNTVRAGGVDAGEQEFLQ